MKPSWKKCWGVPGAKVGDFPIPIIFYTNGLHVINCRVLWTHFFLTMGHHNTLLQALKGINWLINLFSKTIWLERLFKQPLDSFLPCVFLGKTFGVPRAYSPCSPLFSSLQWNKWVMGNHEIHFWVTLLLRVQKRGHTQEIL